MTRTLTISLLLFFLADAIGCLLFLFVDWYEIRKEMHHFLDSKAMESKAVTLTLDNEELAQLQWIEKDREFLYEGKLYDVVDVHQHHQLTRILCVMDEREASLFQTMGKLVSHEQSDANHEHSVLINVFKFLSSLVFHAIDYSTPRDMVSVRPMDAFSSHYHFIFHSSPIQPPDQVSFPI